ncbi:hypothetical protein acdb102_22750 [Acidothermaceae bacterium B102]|nr:hypothetical protein acdb102_22750 [Acidothermaceae bacterium B102]
MTDSEMDIASVFRLATDRPSRVVTYDDVRQRVQRFQRRRAFAAATLAVAALGGVVSFALAGGPGGGPNVPSASPPAHVDSEPVTSSGLAFPPQVATTTAPPPPAPYSPNPALAKQANSICQRGVAYELAHPFPLGAFDPRHPTTKDLPNFATYWRAVQAQAIVKELDKMKVPRADAGVWPNFTSGMDRWYALEAVQLAAAQASDVSAFLAVREPLAASIREAELGMTISGIQVKDACYVLIRSYQEHS